MFYQILFQFCNWRPGNEYSLFQYIETLSKLMNNIRENWYLNSRFSIIANILQGEFDVSSFDTPVHVAATALKSFFSCLPESLIPTAYHLRWKQIMMVSDDIKVCFRKKRRYWSNLQKLENIWKSIETEIFLTFKIKMSIRNYIMKLSGYDQKN